LNPRDFVRIHRSAIVNLRYVRELHPWFHGYHLVVLESGQKLRMSRYQKELAAKLGIGSQSILDALHGLVLSSRRSSAEVLQFCKSGDTKVGRHL
jgi:hypothetical protein